MNQNICINKGVHNEIIIPEFYKEDRELHQKIFLEALGGGGLTR